MDSSSRDSTGLPLTGGFAVVAAVMLAFFAVKLPPLQGSRPPATSPVKHQIGGSEEVSARLWQDPFRAVYRHINDPEQTTRSPVRTPADLAFDIRRRVENGTPVTLIGVMTFGGPYPENAERRLRSRYAVISGLNSRGYIPDDPDHVGYVSFCPRHHGSDPATGVDRGRSAEDSEPTFSGAACPTQTVPVPYEWFVGEDSGAVLAVLWLDDDALQRRPLDHLDDLFGQLDCFCPDVRKVVIGPAGSTNLRFMLEQLRAASGGASGEAAPWQAIAGLRLFSSSATAARFLDWQQPQAPRLIDDLQARCGGIEECFSESGIVFRRTIATDRAVLDALVNELRARGISPVRDRVALISEWDTDYGRSLPETFRAAAYEACVSREQTGDDGACEGDNFERYSYLRGLDGVVPRGQADETDPTGRKPAEGDRGRAVERPVGRSQADYLRRLGDRIAARNAQLRGSEGGDRRGIRAIGVLGSDVYDKIMILQALRDRFPGAIFFTTDLDASLLHPADYAWTRNLVIGSAYGLDLDPALQQGIPPFRDVYQSSLYLTTQVATSSIIPTQSQIDCLAPPKIIEVARFRAHVYDDEASRADLDCREEALLTLLEDYLPDGPGPSTSAFNHGYSTVLRRASYVIAFSLLFVYFSVRFFSDRPPRLDERGFYRDELIWVLGGVVIVVLSGSLPYALRAHPVWHLSIFATALFLTASLMYSRDRARARPGPSAAGDTEPAPRRPGWTRALIDGPIANLLVPALLGGSIGISLSLAGLPAFTRSIPAPLVVFPVALIALTFLLWRAANSEGETDLWRNAWLVTFGGALTAALVALIAAQSTTGEPMSMTSGISIWPGELVRVVGGLLSLYLLVHAIRALAVNRGAVEEALRLPSLFAKGSGDEINGVWKRYALDEAGPRRMARAVSLAVIFFVITGSIVQIQPPFVPYRGPTAFWVDKYLILGFAVPLLLILTMFVLDATKRFNRLLTQFRDLVTRHFDAANPDDIWEVVRVVALRSEAIAPLVIYPVVVILVLALSRLTYFDKWDFPATLYLVIGLTTLYPVYCALGVRRSAERVREAALFVLNQRLRIAYHHEQSASSTGDEQSGTSAGDAQSGTSTDDERQSRTATSEEIRLVIERVQAIRQGAFRPYSQQPWLQSLVLFFGGSGSLVLLEYFVWVR